MVWQLFVCFVLICGLIILLYNEYLYLKIKDINPYHLKQAETEVNLICERIKNEQMLYRQSVGRAKREFSCDIKCDTSDFEKLKTDILDSWKGLPNVIQPTVRWSRE